MRDATIAANYAEALLALAERAKDPAGWGVMFGDIADAVERDPALRRFLESPRISERTKNDVLARALQDRVPRLLVRFLAMLLHHRRQMLIGEIAREYNRLLDQLEGRVRADVTVARDMDGAERDALAARLTPTLGGGRDVVPVIRIHPPILGGMIVRVGDTVADGSVRTRLARLRRRLAAAQ